MTNGSRPENRGRPDGSGTLRGGSPSTARTIACVCSGVVPQQPPTRLTSPSSAKARRYRLVSAACSSWSPSAFGRPAFGMARDVRRRDVREPFEERPHVRRAERAVDADDERLGVLDGDPERIRRLAGEVPAALVDRREREPQRQLGRGGARGDDRSLRIQRVEDRLDHEEVDAPVAQRAICSSYAAWTCSKVTARYAGSSTFGDSDSVTFSGPTEPATNRGLSGVLCGPAHPRPRGQAARLRSSSPPHGLERVVGLPDRGRGEGVRRRDVGAGLEVRVVDLRDDLGCVRLRRSGSPLTSCVCEAKRSPRYSSSESSRRWMSTPHEPSSTRMRSARRSSSCARVSFTNSAPA